VRRIWDRHAEAIVVGIAVALVSGCHDYLERYVFTHWIWVVKLLYWGVVLGGAVTIISTFRQKCLVPLLWGALAVLLGATTLPVIAREAYLIPSLEHRRREAIRLRATDEQEDEVRWDESNESRVAFSEGGMLDEWVAYVYDPTGLVMKSADYKDNRNKLMGDEYREVRELFGGDLVWAEPIGRGWYRCGFT
jgi:hypothetical protein